MVNLTGALLRRATFNIQPDNYWRRRQILKMSAHFYGRARNCKTVAIRLVTKYLQLQMLTRKRMKAMMRGLWESRVTAGAEELGYTPQGTPTILEALSRHNVLINRRMLQDLAIWEPRSFKAVNKVAAVTAHDINLPNLGPKPKV